MDRQSLIAFATLLLLAGCGRAHDVGACDESLEEGDPCTGEWTCPASSLAGSTAEHFTQTRCEGSVVTTRHWSEPYGGGTDGGAPPPTPDAGPPPTPDAGPPAVPDAGRLDAGSPPTPDAGAAGVVGIPCGAEVCDAGSEVCLACEGDSGRFVGCAPYPAVRDYYFSAFHTAGCHGVSGVYAECDGPEDCASGVCGMSGGENAYIVCRDEAVEGEGRACHDAADCGGDACDVTTDRLVATYAEAYADELGWTPRACVR